MAMNKKEQAAMAEMEKNLRLAKALRWSEPVSKDVSPPSGYQSIASGFVFNADNGSVEPAWSSPGHHGIGRSEPETKYSGRQNPIYMFSTRLLALRGLRNAVEREAAEKLAAIDEQIERELAVINPAVA